jgi:hypothetical protein
VRSAPSDDAAVVLFCTLFGLGAGILVVPVAHRQYYLMLLPILCLFAADGLDFLLALAKARWRPGLLATALLALSILPVLGLREAYADRNDAQLERLRYVFAHTQPGDVVLDGWEGTGVFRPHAFRYFFLHDEALAMLPDRERDAFLDALERGRVRPALIALDDQLVFLGSRFLRFVRKNYTTTDGFFYLPKPPSRAHPQ